MHPREELWISRAIDRCATEADWRALTAVAVHDRDVWRRLCRTLEAETLLGARLSPLLPALVPAASPAPAAARRPPLRRVGAWLAAAAVLLAFWCGRMSAAPPTASPSEPRPLHAGSADELFGAYVAAGTRSGRLLEQLPVRTLATRQLPGDEGLEVVFVRSLVERTHIDRALTLVADEHGRPTPSPVDLTNYVLPTNY
ncbi:MAG TPA: hypothetical protein VFZ65_14055 [Planctomycetota bacterium]|nr:hypothetical protein [Planctomycetota bacterium]